MTAPVESHGVTGTFVRPCQSCGRTVRVVDTVEQPHVCIPAETAGEGLARAWWAGHAQGQFDAARPDPVESTPDGGTGETFDPGNPITSGDLIEDEDGAPLPHELQRGGRISQAVWDVVIEQMPYEASPRQIMGCHEGVLIALAPILWPLLPSNDHSRPVVSSPVQVDGETDAADLLYDAWVLIANARDWHGGGESAEWRQAAIRWRDRWHETLPGGDAPTCSRCDLTCAPTWVRTADGAAVCYDCATDDEWTTALGASS